jgi:hypothetical protein
LLFERPVIVKVDFLIKGKNPLFSGQEFPATRHESKISFRAFGFGGFTRVKDDCCYT